MMRQIAVLLLLAVCLAGCGQTQAVREEEAVNAIIKLGGTVTRDKNLPGRPVVGVDLGSTEITDFDLRHLKEFSCLQVVYLSYTSITDTSLEKLKALKGLRALVLVCTRITDAGMEDLRQALPRTAVYGP